MKRITLFSLLLISSIVCLNAQSLWTSAADNTISENQKKQRKTTPSKFDVFQLDLEALKTTLTTAGETLDQSVTVAFPLQEKIQDFRVIKASVLAPELSARFPHITSYIGQATNDASTLIRFSLGSDGFHGMIYSGNFETLFIDPYTSDNKNYILYAKKDLPALSNAMDCLVEGSSYAGRVAPDTSVARNAFDGQLRTYRLALASTGEYSQFHINDQGISPFATDEVKKAGVLSAMNTTMTRVNGIFERDLGVRMIIVPNNTVLIFLDAATDNLSNNSAGALIGQSQNICDTLIGNANYDIGHTFSTGGGGLAGLGVVCFTGQKGSGITGLGSPIGDPYDVDYVAHEMGHQFGANHTQNNNCQRNFNTAMEPGSASSIMGYAGICAPNVQSNSDAYFHAISIQEMWGEVSAHTCDVENPTGNSAPTITPLTNYTVPVATPLVLKGNGADADTNNVLTYCWEQMDNIPSPMPPQATSTTGPAFRTLTPTTSPDRYLPELPTVLGGSTSTTWEVIPTVTRNMTFRLTVRDNNMNGGNTASADMTISTNAAAGPFTVTSQAATTDWDGNSFQTITWNVANTNVAPVNAANVDIVLSTDGGLTFTTVLANDVPNDGSQDIIVPNIDSPNNRIMVIGSDNIFFNVNAANIAITSTLSVDEFGFNNFSLYPNPSKGTINITFNSNSSEDVNIDLYDVRGRKINTQSFANSGGIFNQQVQYKNLETGLYFMKIKNDKNEITRRILID